MFSIPLVPLSTNSYISICRILSAYHMCMTRLHGGIDYVLNYPYEFLHRIIHSHLVVELHLGTVIGF
jgi:hypothetical protein